MPPSPGRHIRSTAVAVTLTLGVAGALVACGGDGKKKADWAEICVRQTEQIRVSDAECANNRTGAIAGWYYIPRKSGGKSNFVPAVGSSIMSVTGGTFERPKKGKILRGTFGTSGQGSGGGSSSSGGGSSGGGSSGGKGGSSGGKGSGGGRR